MLDLGATGISVLSISFMLAMVTGSLIVPSVSKKVGGRVTFLAGGIWMGLGYFFMGYIHLFSLELFRYIALSFVAVMMGMNLMFMHIPMSVTLMKNVDRSLMTRVFAFISVLGLSAVPIGGGIVGALVRFVEIPSLFVFASLGVILIFISQIFNKSIHQMNVKIVEEMSLAEGLEESPEK